MNLPTNTTKVFFDTEFTGLHKDTTLVSIGLISECGKTFYAELTDYAKGQIDEWLQENVISKLTLSYLGHDIENCGVTDNTDPSNIKFRGTLEHLRVDLTKWLSQFERVEMWSDCLSFDWVLFCNIFGHAFNVPSNVYYIPFDICTLFYAKDIDPDVSREEFAGLKNNAHKHNALWDAKVIKSCFEKLKLT